MLRSPAIRLAATALTASVLSVTGFMGVAHAQTVPGGGTPANCVQNIPEGDFACGSGSVASPGSGTMAIGVNAKANGDAATAVGFNATAGSISATAFGQNAQATSTGAVAIGQGAN